MRALPILLLFCASVQASERWATPDLGAQLVSGTWNERLSAVNQLGARGQAAFPELKKALDDPDWQVRMTAVHWVARLGTPAAPVLEEVLGREKCPLVRLTTSHKLGRFGSRPPPAAPGGKKDQGLAACRSWTWPLTEEYLHTRKKKPKPVESTKIDDQGCQYIQFKRSGRSICPNGFILKGVGATPGHIEILQEGRQPKAGVALCCRADREEATIVADLPKPQEVECRLHPMECPPPWLEMAPPDGRFWSRKQREFRRTRRMKRGGIAWIHCCRPHQTGGTEYFPPAKESMIRAIPERPPTAEVGETLESYREVEDQPVYEDFSSMPEREIAERMLAKKTRTSRPSALPVPAPAPSEELPSMAEQQPATAPEQADVDIRERAFEYLLAAEEDSARDDEPEPVLEARAVGAAERRLPAPAGLPRRTAEPVDAEAAPDRPDRDAERLELDAAPEAFGAPEDRLGAPAGLGPRAEAPLGASADIMEDGGKIVRHDPLPELLRLLRGGNALQRLRAADELGRIGPRAAAAVTLLERAARDKNPRLRSSAVLALGNITAGTDAALKTLRRALNDEHLDVRYSAATALGRLGSPSARQTFNRHLRLETRHFLRGGAQ
ncbi:MAG: HEAT repeat domain-containing protein [Elusimicrobiota bacterium]